MATYDHEKVLIDYGKGRIDIEMAMGHALQHIGQLYAAQTGATTDRQALQKRVHTLEGDVKTLQTTVDRLQKTQTERLQTLETGLSTLQRTVVAWKADLAAVTHPT